MNHYANPKAATEIVLYRNGKILISKRGVEPNKGTFDMPGGFTELHEDLEASLARETEEELGITPETYTKPTYVRSYNIEYHYSKKVYRVLVAVYAARLHEDATPIASDDVASIRWIAESEIDNIHWSHEQQKHTAKIIFETFTR